MQGQQGATYTVTVSNAASAGPTSGTVTVTDTIPSGLTLVSMAGPGWTCAANTCTRNDVLNGGSSYPAITVTVNVASNASSPQVNSVSDFGWGESQSASGNLTRRRSRYCQLPQWPHSLAPIPPRKGTGRESMERMDIPLPIPCYQKSSGLCDVCVEWDALHLVSGTTDPRALAIPGARGELHPAGITDRPSVLASTSRTGIPIRSRSMPSIGTAGEGRNRFRL